MRHTRTRRRFRLILISLFAICLTLLVETRIEAFVPQLKNIAVQKIEARFDDKVKISIGGLEGGLLHPFAFNDIKILNKKDTVLFPSLVIGSIRTNYRIWDVLFGRSNYVAVMSKILPSDSCIYINFSTKNKEVIGFAALEGGLSDSRVKGYVILFGKERVDFAGKIKEDSFDLEFRPGKGIIRAEGTISETDGLVVNLKINHLKAAGYDIVCDAVLKNKAGSLEGELETKNLVLNYRPLLDFKASYRMANGVLDIPGLYFGDAIRFRGRIVLKKPQAADVIILTNNLNLNWLLYSLGAGDATSLLSGTLNGKFELQGPADKLKLSAHMEIKKGTISNLDFEYMTATLKGEWPYVRIEDSRITRESGYFSLAGEMDIRKFGKAALFNDIKLSSDDKAINWDGWNTRVLPDVQEVRMKKKINEDVNIDFKKFISDENKIDESLRDTDEVQFEYKLHPHESLRMAVGADKDFLGFEHKDKF